MEEITHHLEQRYPAQPQPEYTILVRLYANRVGRRVVFSLSDAEIHQEKDIVKFLKALARDPSLEPYTTKRPDPHRRKPLGIPIKDPAHIVIVLDDAVDWRFRADGPAITAKDDYGDCNFGSWHVDPNGNPLQKPEAGCRMAFFFAAKRPPVSSPIAVQSFNFHVELEQEQQRWLGLIIDPDVPETGGTGFPFLMAEEEPATEADAKGKLKGKPKAESGSDPEPGANDSLKF